MRDFLTRLHGNSTFIDCRALKGTENKTFFASSVDEVIEWANNYKQFNLFVGVCPRFTKDSTKRGVQQSSWLWADIDLKHSSCETVKDLMALTLSSFALPPTMLIESGGGIHLYWRLLEAQTDLELIEQLNKDIAGQIHGDHVFDVSRIMRLPDTLNYKYDPPVQTRVSLLTEAIYSVSDIQAAFKVDSKLLVKIHKASIKGYHSRSELDYAVIAGLVRIGLSDTAIQYVFDYFTIGDKHREEDSEHYFEFSLDKARVETKITEDRGEKLATLSDDTLFIEDNNCYHILTKQGALEPISTFVFKPIALLQGGQEDIFLGTVLTETDAFENVTMPRCAFASVSSLLRYLPNMHWQWLGSDKMVRALLPYLVDQWGGSTQEAISVIGVHDGEFVCKSTILTKTGIIEPSKAKHRFVDTGKEKPELLLVKATNLQEQLQKFNVLLEQLNKPHVVYNMLGWFVAALCKPQLEAHGVRFPFLNVFGTRGSGKTTLITKVFQPLIGYTKPTTYTIAGTTNFVLLSLLGWSNNIPISLSEFRHSSVTHIERFLNYLRMAYDSGKDARGRADQTTITYPLISPIVVDGEDSISDPACQERSIPVDLDPSSIDESTDAFAAFYDFQNKEFGFSQDLMQFALGYDVTDYDECLALVKQAIPQNLPPRIRYNLACVLFGLRLWYNFCDKQFDIPEPASIFIPVLENLLADSNVGRTELDVDKFVTDIVNEIARNDLSNQFIWKYEKEENCLYFHLTTAHSWWIKKRRLEGNGSLEKSAIKRQLKERRVDAGGVVGNYVIGSAKPKSINGKTSSAYAIDIDMAQRAGLDISETLSQVLVRL